MDRPIGKAAEGDAPRIGGATSKISARLRGVQEDLIDLEPADVPEVRRSVVEPVLAGMLRPGELGWLEVGCSPVHVLVVGAARLLGGKLSDDHRVQAGSSEP